MDECSATWRKERFSDSTINAALNTGGPPEEFLFVWTNSWFYHSGKAFPRMGFNRTSFKKGTAASSD
jgi:hypothetical protein